MVALTDAQFAIRDDHRPLYASKTPQNPSETKEPTLPGILPF